MLKLIFLYLSFLISMHAYAISETNFSQTYKQYLIPYSAQSQIEMIHGVQDVEIRFQVFNEFSSQCLLILPGRQEPLDKYLELAYDLNHSQFSHPMTIVIVDHRGQGLSGRMTSNPQIGYVDHFEDYVLDADLILNTKMSELGCKTNYLLAHSMGGAIGLGLVLRNSTKFKAALFSAPMWEINTKPYPNFMASLIGGFNSFLGNSKKYALGQHDYIESTLKETTTTHSAHRLEIAQSIYRDQPATKVGGVSNRWIFESLKFTKSLRKNASKINLPIVILQAGLDTFVNKNGQDEICHKARFCQKYFFPTSFHEIFMEKDKIRNEALMITMRFFMEHR